MTIEKPKRKWHELSADEKERRAEVKAARAAKRAQEEADEKVYEAALKGKKLALARASRLTNLDEKERGELFTWMRNCPYDDAVRQFLRELGLKDVTSQELNDFFQREARHHWEVRISRAASEANALLQVVEENPTQFSSGILAALGQEAFRQVASGEVSPDAMAKMTTLFLRARGDERAEQALELKRQRAEFEFRTHTERALEAFAEEVEQHPGARQALEALRAELLGEATTTNPSP